MSDVPQQITVQVPAGDRERHSAAWYAHVAAAAIAAVSNGARTTPVPAPFSHVCTSTCTQSVHGHTGTTMHAFAHTLDEHRTMKHCAKCMYITKVTPVEERAGLGVWRSKKRVLVYKCGRSVCGRTGVPCVTCKDGLGKAARPGKHWVPTDEKQCYLCTGGAKVEQDFRAERVLRGLKELIAPLLSAAVSTAPASSVLGVTASAGTADSVCAAGPPGDEATRAAEQDPTCDATAGAGSLPMTPEHVRAYNALFVELVSATPGIAEIAHLLLKFVLLVPSLMLDKEWLLDVSAVGASTVLRRLTELFIREGDEDMPFDKSVDTMLWALRQIGERGLSMSPPYRTLWSSGTVQVPVRPGEDAPTRQVNLRDQWLSEVEDMRASVDAIRPRLARLSCVDVQCAPVVAMEREGEVSMPTLPGKVHTLRDAADAARSARRSSDPGQAGAETEAEKPGGGTATKEEMSAADITGGASLTFAEMQYGKKKRYGVMDAVDFVNDAGDVLDIGMGAKDVATVAAAGTSITATGFGTAGSASGLLAQSFTVADTTMKLHDHISLSLIMYAADGVAAATGSMAAASALGVGGLIYVGLSPTVTAIKGLNWLLPKDGAGSMARVGAYAGASVGTIGSGGVVAVAAAHAAEATMLASAVEGLGAIGAAAGGGTAVGLTMVSAVPAALALATAGAMYGGVKLGQHIAKTYTASVSAFRRIRDAEINRIVDGEMNRVFDVLAHAACAHRSLPRSYANRALISRSPDPADPASAQTHELRHWHIINAAFVRDSTAPAGTRILDRSRRIANVLLCSCCNRASCFSPLEAVSNVSRGTFKCGLCDGVTTPCRLCDVGMAKNPLEWCSLCWAPTDEKLAVTAVLSIPSTIGLWHRINDEAPEPPTKAKGIAHRAGAHAKKLLQRGWQLFDARGQTVASTAPVPAEDPVEVPTDTPIPDGGASGAASLPATAGGDPLTTSAAPAAAFSSNQDDDNAEASSRRLLDS